MPNDISYFKVPGDSATYQFNDPDAENRIGALESTVNDQAGEIADNTTAINANASAIGTLSNLTTSAKGSLVAAINEVDAHADTNASAISQLNSNLAEKTFKSNSYAQTSSYTISLPKSPRNGMTYMVILKHYTSTTTFATDIILLTFTSATTVYRADVVKNSTATISSISVSGSDVTLTFAATAYLAAYAISLV